jgi:AraC-like DNA-binding protein
MVAQCCKVGYGGFVMTDPIDTDLAETACLERLCKVPSVDRLAFAPEGNGLVRLEACLAAHAYRPHRHDTYAIGITLTGVQRYNYRKSRRESLPGEVVILHPDELHDGQSGTDGALLYRMLYIRPEAVLDALVDRSSALPFVREGHSKDGRMAKAVLRALGDFSRPLEPLEVNDVVAGLAEALLALDGTLAFRRSTRSGASAAVGCAREMLDEAGPALITSHDLEAVTGLNRFNLTRQFRRAYGTSPYRYHLMRRLETSREMLRAPDARLAEIATAVGFADQAHFTRQFTMAFGLTPGLWKTLSCKGRNEPPPARN